MTLDEAYRAAAELLEQRGQLLNGQLFRLVEGDKVLFRDVRESLIREGLAEDRAGVGLAMRPFTLGADCNLESVEKDQPPTDLEPRPNDGTDANLSADRNSFSFQPQASSLSHVEPDWWLMVAGITKGPFDFETLLQMQQLGEIVPGDVVRRGAHGLWTQLSELLRLSNDRDSTRGVRDMRQTAQGGVGNSQPGGMGRDSSSSRSDSPADSESPKRYVPPEKIWSRDDRRPSRLSQVWGFVANLCGGSKRLVQVLLTLSAISAFVYWWGQPPPAKTIYQEFAVCNSSLQKLRERRIGRSEWAPTVNRLRPRVKSLVSRLQFRRSPVEKELYQAGTLGLLPLLDIPSDPTNAERAFDKHMAAARQLIDQVPPQAAANVK